MRDLFIDVFTSSRQQSFLRVCIVGATLCFALAVLMSGHTSTWAIVVLPVLGVLCALNPHTGFPTATMLYLLAVWAAGVETPWTPWSLVAAVCMLVLHTCCAIAAGTPSQAPLPPGFWTVYAVRVGIIAAATTLLWALAALTEVTRLHGGVVAGLAALAVITLGLVVHYRLVTRKEDVGGPADQFTDRRDHGFYGLPQGPA